MFFVDAIRLYPLAAELVAPAEVDTANLVLHYAFDGDFQDNSGKGNHGTPINDPVVSVDAERGQVLTLDGFNRGVAVPEIGVSQTATICMWANPAALDDWDGLFHTNGWAANALHWRFKNSRLNGGLYGAPGLNGNAVIQTSQWYHVAFVVTDSESSIWLNGLMEDSAAHPEDLEAPLMVALGGGTVGSWINASGDMSRQFEGMLDDVRIYNRALSQGELLGLVGRTAPISKGF